MGRNRKFGNDVSDTCFRVWVGIKVIFALDISPHKVRINAVRECAEDGVV